MDSFYKHYNPERIFLNIFENFASLKKDFIGVSFHLEGILSVILHLFVAIAIITVLYLIGKKIKEFSFKNRYFDKVDPFISIGLGFIVVGTGILILGILSILYTQIIILYLLTLVIFAVYPFRHLFRLFKLLAQAVRNKYHFFETKKWFFLCIFSFVLISFLRLLPPEIGEDAVGYHTDLPTIYLKEHTMLINNINSEDFLQVIPSPQLGESLYLIAIFLNLKDASRYFHFLFYLLVLYLIYFIAKNKNSGLYAVIIFVTASVVIRHATKANVDFQALFCWLLAVFLLTKYKKYTINTVILSGLFFGGALSTKLWEIAFFPVFFLYIILTQKNKLHALKLILLFLFFSILIPGIWYLRSYLITGNPVFPALAFNKSPTYIGINWQMFHYTNLVGYSPLFYFGTIFLVTKLPQLIKTFKKTNFTLFFVLLAFEHLFIQYYLPRYLLNLYAISVLVVSFGVARFISTVRVGKYIFYSVFGVLFFYYFMNTLLIIPYGLGWADKDKYLTRILTKDSSSYYDFDDLFEKHISKYDLVAIYSLSGFYYAEFSYIDIGYIFNRSKNFDLLKTKGVTKLLIRGGNIDWFCRKNELTNCDKNKYKLLAGYPPKPMYLYSINAK